ncbi:MAG: hypothetical protein ACK4PI_14055 [Tepidisphaerales bacterium]
MKTSRRKAQVGLIAALLLMAACLGVLLLQERDAGAQVPAGRGSPPALQAK